MIQEEIKAINASFSTLYVSCAEQCRKLTQSPNASLTSLMVSRLILSLRSVVQSTYDEDQTFELQQDGLQFVDELMNSKRSRFLTGRYY